MATDGTTTQDTARAGLDRSTIVALAAMGVAVFVVANDFTALSVALPAMERDLGTDLSTVQWVINAYALVFGMLIVTCGRLADMLGRRRAFVAGALVFATFSLLAGLMPSALGLILCRALMGVGGALMWPAILGMTFAALPEERAGLAGGLILGAAGLGNAAGPLIGGLLTDALSWRWIMFLNLPIAALAILATVRAIPRDAPGERDRLDLAGMATLGAALLCALLALDQTPEWGLTDPRVLALLGVAVLGLAAFALVERRAGERALVPASIIRNRDFAAACAAVLLMSAVFFAALLYLPQFMAKVLGFTPLESGAGLLPMMATFACVSFAAGPLYDRIGPKTTVTCGAAAITAGILALSFLDPGWSYLALVPGMVVLGIGVGLFYSSITTAGVTALDPAQASLAGAIVYMFQIAGGAIGLGVNTAIVASAGEGTAGLVAGIGDAFRLDALLAGCAVLVAAAFVGGRGRFADRLHLHRPHLHRAHG